MLKVVAARLIFKPLEFERFKIGVNYGEFAIIAKPVEFAGIKRKSHGTGTALKTFLMMASVVTACASAS
jgi:hypothetical protein